MDEYKSRLSDYLSDMVREELEKYDGGFTDEWNDQRKKNAEVLGYKLSGKSDIKEGATEFWQDMFRPGNIPNQYINQLIKKKGELPSKKHIKQIYRDNGNPSSSQLKKAFKELAKEKYIKKQGSMWKWESGFAWRTGTELESVNEELQNSQGEQTDFKKGDLVKDINPDCPHHGSEGEVTKVGKGTITFDVSNNGKNYQQGDELEKTVDQMVKLKESVNEGFTKYHIRLTDTPGWYGVWDKNGKQKFEGDRKFVTKHLKKLKTRMGNFQLKSLIDVATKKKGKNIEFDVVESVNERIDKRQAAETLKQLGGNKFIAMTGAKNFGFGSKGMVFKIGRNSKGVNYVRIDLRNDLYDMEFIQMRAGREKIKSKIKGVYNDQLQKIFTKHTGMYTRL